MGIISSDKDDFEKLLNYFKIHPKCEKEIIELFKSRGNDVKLLTVFTTRLGQLKELGVSAVKLGRKSFEILKQTNGIYSMHIDTAEVNYRVLYSFTRENSILLHVFFEKAGKKATDYKTAIPIAQHRRKEWEEGIYE